MLHIAPGDSAGGGIAAAVRQLGRDDAVLPSLDDLSCGPIDPDIPAVREEWWRQFYEQDDVAERLSEFWKRVDANEDEIVVWFGRHSASELSFFIHWVERMGDRPYQAIDVTGSKFAYTDKDGAVAMSEPAQAVGMLSPENLATLFGTEQPLNQPERKAVTQRWQSLRAENAPFRVVSEQGLISAPLDYFDPQILAEATLKWRPARLVIGYALGHNMKPYLQTGHVMLLARLAALVEQGRLVADGDPYDFDTPIRLG